MSETDFSDESESDGDDDDAIDNTLLLLHHQRLLKKKRGTVVHSRYRKTYYRGLRQSARRLRDRRIPRASLVKPDESPWKYLYDSGNDQALVTATGVDHATFAFLLASFEPLYDNHTIDKDTGEIRERAPRSKGGRPRSLNAAACLGMTLMWTRTRGAEWSLSMLFGTTGTPTSVWIRFGRRILVDVLRASPEGDIKMPSEEELEEYIEAISDRHPNLGRERVWGAMDGLKLHLEQSGDHIIQNMFYNGWTCDHYVTNLFLFAPDGTICLRVTNCPGAVHDSIVGSWGRVYKKILRIYERYGAKITVDSAFAGEGNDYLIKSAQSVANAESNAEVLMLREATSMRQASEWGMRGLQGSFPRLKDRFVYEERGERQLMLEMFVRLYNLRARLVGMNQIQSHYMPWLDRSAYDVF